MRVDEPAEAVVDFAELGIVDGSDEDTSRGAGVNMAALGILEAPDKQVHLHHPGEELGADKPTNNELRKLFDLMDADRSGAVSKFEMCLKTRDNPEIRRLLQEDPLLQKRIDAMRDAINGGDRTELNWLDFCDLYESVAVNRKSLAAPSDPSTGNSTQGAGNRRQRRQQGGFFEASDVPRPTIVAKPRTSTDSTSPRGGDDEEEDAQGGEVAVGVASFDVGTPTASQDSNFGDLDLAAVADSRSASVDLTQVENSPAQEAFFVDCQPPDRQVDGERRVKILGARNLFGEGHAPKFPWEDNGDVMHCIFQVQGKPATQFETSSVAASDTPLWNYSQVVSNYADGDSLEFLVMSSAAGFLGSATIKASDLASAGGSFDGEVSLAGGDNANAKLKVQVEAPCGNASSPEVAKVPSMLADELEESW